MKIAVISGSHRVKSESERVARYIAADITSAGHTSYILSLADNPLPLWDEGVWRDDPGWKSVWGPVADELRGADALVIITPEWSGMVPPGLKNFFLLCSAKEVGHKPALIVSVSSGMGGAYPITELRSSSYKNTRICYIPEHLIIRHVGSMLKDDPPTDPHDRSLRERITYSVALLIEYGTALRLVRDSGVIDLVKFPNGM